MPEIESAIVRVVAEVSKKLAPTLAAVPAPRLRFPTEAVEELLTELGAEAAMLLDYLDSPDFAAVVAQLQFNGDLGQVAKDQLYQGLRLAGLTNGLMLHRLVDVLHDVVTAACASVYGQISRRTSMVDQHDLLAAGTENSRMLMRLKSLTEFQTFAAHMRSQVAALHDRIRLPHIGVSRAVPYDQLYVQPNLDSPKVHLGAPGNRTVILGDPGAGKSTLAAKFAYSVATDDTGRVPFLVVLREFTGSFAEGGRDLLQYLEMLCRAPYNVRPPQDGVEYLLRTGRAIVVLDGLDELVRTDLRRKVVELVEGFAHLYPLVPILVTARKIGYFEAPLSGHLFTREHILEFDNYQVHEYVRRWFTLDEATSPADRGLLADSFMEDSDQVPELRSNPLLLALLCAMYSSDRYLPRNLAQVYERCALMLFEQWDLKRGIELPLSFQGRLRGAVQHLAWKLFSAKESGKGQTHTRIVRMLTEYLDTKVDDHDESVATAEMFLAFCTGRSWILTDVGATRTEPAYGFTHRTFLEYFAAEHLVRAHRTAKALWNMLRHKTDQWDVVAQIVLQLYDRNVEGGLDELLTTAIDNEGLDFAARSLHYVQPATRTVRAITVAAVYHAAVFPIDKRVRHGGGSLSYFDTPLASCMFQSSAANRPAVERAVIDCLSDLVQRGELGAALVLDTLAYRQEEPRWQEIHDELATRHRDELTELWKTSPWAAGNFPLSKPDVLPEMIRRQGVGPLYAVCYLADSWHMSLAQMVLEHDAVEHAHPDLVATAMAAVPTPWASTAGGLKWRPEFGEVEDALRMMLSLPSLELASTSSRRVPRRWQYADGVPSEVRDFLARWAAGEISVLAPDPEQQPPRQWQH